jgi:hypothetical protein
MMMPLSNDLRECVVAAVGKGHAHLARSLAGQSSVLSSGQHSCLLNVGAGIRSPSAMASASKMVEVPGRCRLEDGPF